MSPSRALHVASVLLCILFAAVGLPGCAPRTAPQTVAEPVPDPDAEAAARAAANDVYSAVDAAAEDYEAGIELLALGQEVAGEERIAAASAALAGAAADCDALPSCEMRQILATFDRLLAYQGIALKQRADEVAELRGRLEVELEPELEREPGTEPFISEIAELDTTVSMLHGNELRELIELNAPVRAALDDWLTWNRPLFMSAWQNYQYLRPQIAPLYEAAGLPEALLFAMIATETGGKVHSYSRAGAAGPLQFMRRTGQRYGLRVVDGFDTRLDPAEATRANIAYLNEQFAALNNSLEKALAAYNGGENRMRGLHRRYGGASLWDSRVYYALPRETREYVPRILAAAWLFLHADEYNLELPSIDPATAELALRDELSIGELTICLGQAGNDEGWFRTLRNLNPRLEPGDRVPAGETLRVPVELVAVYEERCLGGDLLDRARELHDANYPEEPEMILYTVRRGDTLSRIAARHRCVELGELAAINGVRAPRYVIRVGQQLKIPDCP
jgi:membrane-bound lytic murein transglycosylase D